MCVVCDVPCRACRACVCADTAGTADTADTARVCVFCATCRVVCVVRDVSCVCVRVCVYVRVRVYVLSLIHISEPTRRRGISYAVFCLKKKTSTIRISFATDYSLA